MNMSHERLRDEYFMRKTLKLAEKALRAGELPIGAIVARNHDVLTSAYCSDKHERMLAHAELLALMKADARHSSIAERRAMTLYTNLEPCAMCLGAAMSFCIGRIVFGAVAPADGAVTRLSGVVFGNATYLDYKMPDVIGGVLEADSRLLFDAFAHQSKDRALVNFALAISASASD
jgi:tRNA(adenine34) deaminase